MCSCACVSVVPGILQQLIRVSKNAIGSRLAALKSVRPLSLRNRENLCANVVDAESCSLYNEARNRVGPSYFSAVENRAETAKMSNAEPVGQR